MVTRRLTLLALIGCCWWFFGNLYEAVVISPNWVVDSPAQLRRLNEFFITTSPTLYFVPVTPVALVLTWAAAITGRRDPTGSTLKRAAFVSIALTALTVAIVAVLVRGLFGSGYLTHPDDLQTYARWWNVANLVRMGLTAAVVLLLFSAFRGQERNAARAGSSAT